jgi:hypothetical protein
MKKLTFKIESIDYGDLERSIDSIDKKIRELFAPPKVKITKSQVYKFDDDVNAYGVLGNSQGTIIYDFSIDMDERLND